MSKNSTSVFPTFSLLTDCNNSPNMLKLQLPVSVLPLLAGNVFPTLVTNDYVELKIVYIVWLCSLVRCNIVQVQQSDFLNKLWLRPLMRQEELTLFPHSRLQEHYGQRQLDVRSRLPEFSQKKKRSEIAGMYSWFLWIYKLTFLQLLVISWGLCFTSCSEL